MLYLGKYIWAMHWLHQETKTLLPNGFIIFWLSLSRNILTFKAYTYFLPKVYGLTLKYATSKFS